MTIQDDLYTLSDAVEEYGPDPDDEEVVVLIQWDDMKAPNDTDIATMVAGWHDYDSIGLMPNRPDVEWYYVDDAGEVFTLKDLIEGKPEWFDTPDPIPNWYQEDQ